MRVSDRYQRESECAVNVAGAESPWHVYLRVSFVAGTGFEPVTSGL
jgi:hypothetical protein